MPRARKDFQNGARQQLRHFLPDRKRRLLVALPPKKNHLPPDPRQLRREILSNDGAESLPKKRLLLCRAPVRRSAEAKEETPRDFREEGSQRPAGARENFQKPAAEGERKRNPGRREEEDFFESWEPRLFPGEKVKEDAPAVGMPEEKVFLAGFFLLKKLERQRREIAQLPSLFQLAAGAAARPFEKENLPAGSC